MRSFLHLKWPWKRIFSPIFLFSLPSFSFFFPLPFLFSREMGTGNGNERKLPFLLFFLLFCFFSPSFSSFFDFGGENGREIEKKISFFSSFLNSLFGKRNKGATGKFEGNSSSFSFLFSLFFLSFDPSSFQFLGKEMEIWEDKNECPKHAKKILQEQLFVPAKPNCSHLNKIA